MIVWHLRRRSKAASVLCSSLNMLWTNERPGEHICRGIVCCSYTPRYLVCFKPAVGVELATREMSSGDSVRGQPPSAS